MPRVEIGRQSLALGGPGGMLIESGGGAGEDPAVVAEALSSPRIGPVAEQIVDAAAEATARAEEAVEITRAYLADTLGDPREAADRIDVILSVLERLDRDGKHKEALQLARAVNGLLALFYRWADLARSLGIAGRAAKKVKDLASEAWVEHELGTLHLAAGDPGEGVRHLCKARRVRRENGLDGLEATEANLGTFCRQLRGTGDPSPRRRWLLGAAAALLLVLMGGGMGVVLASDDERPPVGTALVTVEREGDGNVVSVPAGIDCPDTCDRRFGRRTTIVLTPEAADGWTFVRWEGRCDGREPCRFLLRGDRTVRAVFAEEASPQPTVSLTVDRPAGGTVVSEPEGIFCPEACEVTVDEGEPLTLTARPGDGFLFTRWGGACADQNGPCAPDMTRDRQVSATFAEAHMISVDVVGPGTVQSDPAGIVCPGDCDEPFPASGGIVILRATGETVARWSPPCARNVQSPTCEMRPGIDRSVTATFDAPPTPEAIEPEAGGG